jgi:hypothetical protein
MATRSATVLVSGTANTAKLFVAALAFTGAYVGFSAYDTANSAPQPTQTVTLSARELPVTSSTATSELEVPKAGKVSISSLPGAAGCAKTFVARSVVVNPDPDRTVMYGWRLARWSAEGRSWQTYLVDYDGFAGVKKTVDWDAGVSGNPGWYRIELSVDGAEKVKSDRFQVTC